MLGKIVFLSFVMSVSLSQNIAKAADLVFCVNKSTRVVTFPSYGVCNKTSQITLNLNSQQSDPNPTSHTSTVQSVPKTQKNPNPTSHTSTVQSVPKTQKQQVFVPNVLAMNMTEAKLLLSNLGFKIQIKGNSANGKIVQVIPKIGSSVAHGSVILLVTK